VFVPTPKRILHAILLCGATVGFFKYFRVDGLDGVTLALRDSFAVQPANGGAFTVNGQSIPSLSMPGNPFGTDHQSLPFQNANTNPFANLNGSTGTPSTADGLWAAQNNPQVTSTNFATNVPAARPLYQRNATLRVGAFNRELIDLAMIRDPFMGDRLVQILSEYGCVAVQFMDVSNRALMPELMRLLNANGKRFEYVDGSVDRVTRQKGLAIIFDTEQLQVDRYQSYSLRDDSGKLTCEPLVAWFRCCAADPREAFTFTFVNAFLTQTPESNESQCLPDVFNSILADGRNEDDIILAGSIANDPAILQSLAQQGIKIVPAENGSGNTTQLQTVMISAACREYSGNSGSFNILRRYNLTPEEANAVSTVAPVWADFDVVEAGIY
jgi:hypothetical protein